MNSKNNTPNLQKNHQTTIEYGRVMYRRGPIPDSQELASYEKILPGMADRILTLAEKQQKTSIRLDVLKWLGEFITMLVTRGFLYFLVIVAFILVMNGKEIAALLAGLGPIISIFIATFKESPPKL